MPIKDIPVTKLKNVGPARAAALSRMGINKVDELLRLYPRSYQNRGDIKLLSDTVDGEKSALLLVIATAPKKALIRRGMSLLKFRAYDESGTAEITYFNQDYLADKFSVGDVFRFYGKVERKSRASGKDSFSLSSPIAEFAGAEPEALPPLVPIYPLTSPLTQNIVSKLTEDALDLYLSGSYADPIPAEVLVENELSTRSFALKNIHAPTSLSALAAAKKRLIFEEFFLFALGLSIAGRKHSKDGTAPILEGDISPLTSLLPYSLTGAQARAIKDIQTDMTSGTPMSRILVGDVGCGKTICAAAAMFVAVQSGKQAALMAPTEILASQHFNDLYPLFRELGIKTELLKGSTTAAEKRRIYASLAEKNSAKRTDIVIGTHALISEVVEFSDLGLVITDEQHRFGVKQRSALTEKGKHAHMLVMSATPIPRSLALTLYGDLDISVIDEMPPGRQRVDTFAVNESYRERLLSFIEKQTDEGGQVYIVCPAVEEKEQDDENEGEITLDEIAIGDELTIDFEAPSKGSPPLKSAVKYAGELSERFPSLNIAFVHGKMKAQEKDSVMADFSAGKIDVLVSTTVIEVGVNVPNACLMIVENAERFGLSQLHQLRGRVGRGERKSYCVLVSDSEGERARERLETMKNMYDGFAIAEKDLAMRGPGDFLESASGSGIRQSGGLRFRLADMCTDGDLFTSAFTSARSLLASDPELLQSPELLGEVKDLFDLKGNM